MTTRQPDRSAWHKSSRSTGNGNSNCVEVRAAGSGFEIRDSKLGGLSPILAVSVASFEALLAHAVTNSVWDNFSERLNHTSPAWHRTLHSDGTTGAIEVGYAAKGTTALRLADAPEGDILVYTPAEWRAFVEGVNLGEFDPKRLTTDLIPTLCPRSSKHPGQTSSHCSLPRGQTSASIPPDWLARALDHEARASWYLNAVRTFNFSKACSIWARTFQR
ncbi:DUF397 domain-containing protein [Glycomyces sp. MUSA5-2]|uniref:DUF397 domain-containing protein n=1 Tax=Glycomyces sp. MUSA5-2 TaxID=2053002 RepID=UPI00300A327C